MYGAGGALSTLVSQLSSTPLHVSMYEPETGIVQEPQVHDGPSHGCDPVHVFVGTDRVQERVSPMRQVKPSSVEPLQLSSMPLHDSVAMTVHVPHLQVEEQVRTPLQAPTVQAPDEPRAQS